MWTLSGVLSASGDGPPPGVLQGNCHSLPALRPAGVQAGSAVSRSRPNGQRFLPFRRVNTTAHAEETPSAVAPDQILDRMDRALGRTPIDGHGFEQAAVAAVPAVRTAALPRLGFGLIGRLGTPGPMVLPAAPSALTESPSAMTERSSRSR